MICSCWSRLPALGVGFLLLACGGGGSSGTGPCTPGAATHLVTTGGAAQRNGHVDLDRGPTTHCVIFGGSGVGLAGGHFSDVRYVRPPVHEPWKVQLFLQSPREYERNGDGRSLTHSGAGSGERYLPVLGGYRSTFPTPCSRCGSA